MLQTKWLLPKSWSDLFSNISLQENEFLQEHLASAIANCCSWGKNCFEFGRLGAVSPLVDFLHNGNDRVQCTTIEALSHLSTDPFNCITLHQSGVVPVSLLYKFSHQTLTTGCKIWIKNTSLRNVQIQNTMSVFSFNSKTYSLPVFFQFVHWNKLLCDDG